MILQAVRHPAHLGNLLEIQKQVYTKKAALRAWVLPSAEPIAFGALERQAMRPIGQGEVWGKKLGCAWLRLQGQIPAGLENPVLLFDNTGEGLIYTPDGAIFAAHTAVWTPGDIMNSGLAARAYPLDGRAGALELYVDCGFNGFMMVNLGRGRFGGAWVAEKNEAAYGYFYDYLTLFLLADATEDKALARSLFAGLNASFAVFKSQGAGAARARLAPLLAAPSEDGLAYTAIGHGHLDLAWLWPLRETVRKAARTYTKALANLEAYPGYIYGTSQPRQLAWMKKYYPSVYEKVREAILAGRIEMQGAFYVECDTNLPGGESLIRQAIYGRRFIREEFGQEPKMCWLPDVFGFNGNLPQILRGCGMEYFSTIKLAWNKVNDFPYCTFRWQGIDGSEVLAHMPPEGDYNSKAAPGSLLKGARRYPDAPFGTALLAYGMGDGGGGPGETHLEMLAREENLRGLPRVQTGKAEAFFERLAEKEIPHTYKGELYLETHQGTYTSQAKIKKNNRLCERLLHNTEALGVLALQKGGAYPAAALESAWKRVLLNQFHDIIPGSAITRVNLEARESYRKAAGTLQTAMQGSLAALPAAKKPAAVNLTGFARKEYLRHEGAWYAADVKPYAAATLAPAEPPPAGALRAGGNTLSNGLLTLRFSAAGEIVSCTDAEGRQHAKGPLNRLVLHADPFMIPFDAWDISPHYRALPTARLKAASSHSRLDGVRAVRENLYEGPGYTIRQRVALEAGSDVVRFYTRVSWHKSHRMLRAEFAPAAYGDTAWFDIQFGAIRRPTTRHNSIEKAQFEVCGHKWAATEKGGVGFALLNDSKYGHYAKDGLLSLNLLRAPTFPDRWADRGDHSFTYAFCPFRAGDMAKVVRESYRLNHPLLVAKVRPCASLASTSNPAVVLETVKRAEDGGGIVLRLYESCGAGAETALACGIKHRGAYFCDMLETPGEKADLKALSFGPYEVKTILLRTEDEA